MEEQEYKTVGNVKIDPVRSKYDNDAMVSLVLGIIGIVTSWFPVFNIAGLVLSIVGFIKSNKNTAYAQEHGIPEKGTNVGGKWCSIVGIIFCGIVTLFYLFLCILVLIFSTGLVSQTGMFS